MSLGINDDNSAVWIEPVNKEWLVKRGFFPNNRSRENHAEKSQGGGRNEFSLAPRLNAQT
nr:hypothetical protein [Clostridia bacterium]